MMDKNEKGRLRELALSKREGISPVQRAAFSEAIASRLLELEEIEKAQLIMCYRAFRSEVDTAKIVENFSRRGKILCFPLCKKGGLMDAYAPLDENSFRIGMMGIMEPAPERSRLVLPEEIGLVICPMVAFDSARRRMGYGGGYYDRYLPGCKNALRIGIAFEAQRMECVPAEEYDLPMDIIVTEGKIY